jgi:hypothetical protein
MLLREYGNRISSRPVASVTCERSQVSRKREHSDLALRARPFAAQIVVAALGQLPGLVAGSDLEVAMDACDIHARTRRRRLALIAQ